MRPKTSGLRRLMRIDCKALKEMMSNKEKDTAVNLAPSSNFNYEFTHRKYSFIRWFEKSSNSTKKLDNECTHLTNDMFVTRQDNNSGICKWRESKERLGAVWLLHRNGRNWNLSGANRNAFLLMQREKWDRKEAKLKSTTTSEPKFILRFGLMV